MTLGVQGRALVAGVLAVAVVAGCADDGGRTREAASTTSAAPEPADAIVGLCPGEEFVERPRSVLLPRDLGGTDAASTATAAIEAFVSGLRPQEQAEGILVPWPDGADVLRGVSLDEGTLTVDFVRRVIDTYIAAPGSSARFFVPLVDTAFRVPEVDRLELVIHGSVAEWVEWWQGEGSFDRDDWRERHPEPAVSCSTAG